MSTSARLLQEVRYTQIVTIDYFHDLEVRRPFLNAPIYLVYHSSSIPEPDQNLRLVLTDLEVISCKMQTQHTISENSIKQV